MRRLVSIVLAGVVLASCAAIDNFFGGDPGPPPMHDLVVDHPVFLKLEGGPE